MKKINLVSEFFASKKESEWNLLQQDQQDQLEKEFETWFKEQNKDFEFSSKILIKYIAENHHPHTVIILDSVGSQIYEGIQSFPTTEYITE